MSEPRIRLELEYARNLMAQRDAGALGDARVAWDALARAIAGVDNPRTFKAVRRSGKVAETPAFPKPSALEREGKRHKKRGKKARRTMEVYDAVRLRAGGQCECGCGRAFHDGPMLDSAPEMDDFFGGAKHRNSRECWMLRAECHRAKTNNKPDRAEWLRKFIAHCRKYGLDRERYLAQAKLDSREDVRRAAEVSRG